MSVPLSEDDLANAQFAIGVELAARDLYQAAIDAGATGTAWAILADQHGQYAQRVAGADRHPGQHADTTVYDARVANFQGDRPANAAYELENTLIATNATLLGQIVDANVADALASVVVDGVAPRRLSGRALGPRRQPRRPVHLYRHAARAGGRAVSGLSRREVIQSGGMLLAFGAIGAACASNDAGGTPGRVGIAPPPPTLPEVEDPPNDATLLRTAQSMEYAALELYKALVANERAERRRAAHLRPHRPRPHAPRRRDRPADHRCRCPAVSVPERVHDGPLRQSGAGGDGGHRRHCTATCSTSPGRSSRTSARPTRAS